MAESYVLVADNSQATVYRFNRLKKEIALIDQIDHAEGRWKNHDFVTSGSGLSVAASAKEHESETFARMLAKSMNKAYELNNFAQLIVCAPPKLLGEILPFIEKHIPQGDHINKELIQESESQLLERLTELK